MKYLLILLTLLSFSSFANRFDFKVGNDDWSIIHKPDLEAVYMQINHTSNSYTNKLHEEYYCYPNDCPTARQFYDDFIIKANDVLVAYYAGTVPPETNFQAFLAYLISKGTNYDSSGNLVVTK